CGPAIQRKNARRRNCHTHALHLAAMNARATSLAAGQEGLLTHDDMCRYGYSNDEIRYLVDAGHLRRLERGLYAVAGAPETKRQTILAAVLGAGPCAAASHECG